MKGMILAAGFGTRLKPISDELPKPLFPFGNMRIIEKAIGFFKGNGICDIVINLHHKGEQISSFLGDGKRYGVNIVYSEEAEILGTGGGILQAKGFLEGDCFVVMNSDFLLECDLERVIREHKDNKAIATMVLKDAKGKENYGTIGVSIDGLIRQFVSYVDYGGDLPLKQGMFTGIHVFSPRVFEYLEKVAESFFCVNSLVYPEMLRSGEKVMGFFETGLWRDLGTVSDYFDANMEALEKEIFFGFSDSCKVEVGAETMIAGSATLNPPLVIGDRARIEDNVVLGPSVILGNNCVVRTGAAIERSIVLADSEVESKDVLRNEIVFKDLKVYV